MWYKLKNILALAYIIVNNLYKEFCYEKGY